jgi:hypothetical protein
MNERIRQLAEQAGYLRDGFGFGHWDMPECKKFAELIVKECAGLAEDGFDDELDGQEICDSIKQHFGV